ncbi:MAG TPA: ribonuclease III domain-containing protein, partial [Rhodocyclaceae bacterium]|nr:ribonuclease III domain-containing protein [Rhodocyclaceae bacterium]
MQLQLHLLERGLGYKFTERGLLQQAMTHRSFGTPHYERLEFLGDSMLNCVIAAQLFARFPALREGDLSRLRANLVRQDTLHQIA